MASSSSTGTLPEEGPWVQLVLKVLERPWTRVTRVAGGTQFQLALVHVGDNCSRADTVNMDISSSSGLQRPIIVP
jgi:hypothetical protein